MRSIPVGMVFVFFPSSMFSYTYLQKPKKYIWKGHPDIISIGAAATTTTSLMCASDIRNEPNKISVAIKKKRHRNDANPYLLLYSFNEWSQLYNLYLCTIHTVVQSRAFSLTVLFFFFNTYAKVSTKCCHWLRREFGKDLLRQLQWMCEIFIHLPVSDLVRSQHADARFTGTFFFSLCPSLLFSFGSFLSPSFASQGKIFYWGKENDFFLDFCTSAAPFSS